MFDIGLGIDSEISGYDNIRLRGMILGLSVDEIAARCRILSTSRSSVTIWIFRCAPIRPA